MSSKPGFKCQYCGKGYVKEMAFLAHTCPQMEREKMMETNLGLAAFMLYQRWMAYNKRGKPDKSTFMSSKFFKSFVNFAQFVKDLRLDITSYIAFVSDKNLSPSFWTRDDVYDAYLKHFDTVMDTMTHLRTTMATISHLADKYGCDESEVFDHISGIQIVDLLRERKLSPWILLHSSKFAAKLKTCTPETKVRIESCINCGFWIARFQRDTKTVEQVKALIHSIGI